ncbi:MAG: prepilin peptidase [Coriobacteriales bacterium]|jgi:leader peptidase (prepilin peptidase)/N-methyltransferase|nr:prepilin peptidase [Coriobacteriales bacterium]
MINALGILFLVASGILGAVIGSFLNVVIYRLPRGIGFVKGHSFCPHCEHQLKALDMVPVFSYLFLGRTCRYCHAPISARYALVEVLGAASALLCYCALLPPVAFMLPEGAASLTSGATASELGLLAGWLPPAVPALIAASISAALLFIVFCVLLLVSFIDADTMEIPDSLSIWLAALGLIGMGLGPFAGYDWPAHVIGAFCVSLPMLLLALFIPGAFGLGDVKLMAAAGLLLGWQLVIVAVFIGILIGGIYGIFLLATRRKGRKEHFAFGPALCMGIAVSSLLGNTLMNWYLGFF